MNQCFIVVKLIYNISLPSAVPFLPAEHSSRCQHNTLCQRSPNKNRSPKPVFPLRTRTTLSLTTDTRKKILLRPKRSCRLTNPASSLFFFFFFFSPDYSFLATLSGCSFRAVIQCSTRPGPLPKPSWEIKKPNRFFHLKLLWRCSSVICHRRLRSAQADFSLFASRRSPNHALHKAGRVTQLLAIYSCKIPVPRVAEVSSKL